MSEDRIITKGVVINSKIKVQKNIKLGLATLKIKNRIAFWL
jgi:hypothetical protein